MARTVRIGLIQTALSVRADASPDHVKKAMIEKHADRIAGAAHRGAQVICLPELANGPYFCAEQNVKWHALAEPIPDGTTTQLMCELARQHRTVLVVPLAEVESTGVYYNSAAVIDADGLYLGKYRKVHIPHGAAGCWEKFYFKPGNAGYPAFDTRFGRLGVYLGYDRHFFEGARALGLNGAEIVLNPSAEAAVPGEAFWSVELSALAITNQCFVAGANRAGWEEPWRTGEFFGRSLLCSPTGEILAEAKRAEEDVLVADADLDAIRDSRHVLPLIRDRRPETYGPVTSL